MEFNTKLFAIAIAVTSLALAPSIVSTQPVEAESHWCEQQGKSNNWVNGCKSGWYEHDHCFPYEPSGDTKDEVAGWKVGWKHGSCK